MGPLMGPHTGELTDSGSLPARRIAGAPATPHSGDMADLTCPKCHGPMRSYERSGIHVDQCSDCRGIFLDRGELERLVDAETRWAAGAPTQSPPAPAYQQPSAPHPGYQGHPYGHKKRKSFLEDLFD